MFGIIIKLYVPVHVPIAAHVWNLMPLIFFCRIKKIAAALSV